MVSRSRAKAATTSNGAEKEPDSPRSKGAGKTDSQRSKGAGNTLLKSVLTKTSRNRSQTASLQDISNRTDTNSLRNNESKNTSNDLSSSSLDTTGKKRGAALAAFRAFQEQETPRTTMQNFIDVHEESAVTPAAFFSKQHRPSEGGSYIKSVSAINASELISDSSNLEQEGFSAADISSDVSSIEAGPSKRRGQRKRKAAVTADEMDPGKDITQPLNKSNKTLDITDQVSDSSSLDETARVPRNKRKNRKKFEPSDFDFSMPLPPPEPKNKSKASNSTKLDISDMTDLSMDESMEAVIKIRQRKQSRKKKAVQISVADFSVAAPDEEEQVESKVDDDTVEDREIREEMKEKTTSIVTEISTIDSKKKRKREDQEPACELKPPKMAKMDAKTEEDPLHYCHEVVKELLSKKKENIAWPFYKPVDAELNPDYYDKIKTPIDLSTIEEKLRNTEYSTVKEFEQDVSMMFNNCRKYNDPDETIVKNANKLEKFFLTRMSKMGNYTEALVQNLQESHVDKLAKQMIAQGEKGKKPPPTTGRRAPGRGRAKGETVKMLNVRLNVSAPLSEDSTTDVAASMNSIQGTSAVDADDYNKPFHGWSKEVSPRCGLPWVEQDYSGHDLRSPFQVKPSLTICMVAEMETSDVMSLDVGGQHFRTYRSNLLSIPGSLLKKMFDPKSSEFYIQPQENGTTFVDCCPKIFGVILNYLRYKSLVGIFGVDLSDVRVVARHYGVQGLVDLIDLKEIKKEEDLEVNRLIGRKRLIAEEKVRQLIDVDGMGGSLEKKVGGVKRTVGGLEKTVGGLERGEDSRQQGGDSRLHEEDSRRQGEDSLRRGEDSQQQGEDNRKQGGDSRRHQEDSQQQGEDSRQQGGDSRQQGEDSRHEEYGQMFEEYGPGENDNHLDEQLLENAMDVEDLNLYIKVEIDVKEEMEDSTEILTQVKNFKSKEVTEVTPVKLKKEIEEGSDIQIIHCGLCGKIFSNGGALLVHTEEHVNKEKRKCTICPFTGSRPKVLAHIRSKHTGEKLFPCYMCDKVYSSYDSKRNHEKKNHGVGVNIDKPS